MTALRIAMFSDSALPVLNGVSISIDALMTELRNQGHSVHLYTARHPGHRDTDPNVFRFRSLETPISKGYPVSIPPFYRMLHKFRRHTYDVIHTHTPFIAGMVGLRWSESHQVPIVSTYHTLYDRYAHYFRLLPRRYVRFRIAKHTNFYYNHVEHVLTPSEASMKWLKRHSVNTPISVVPTGIVRGPIRDKREVRFRLGISPESMVLLYVGRLAREKNLLTLIDAANLVFQQRPNARLWLIGDGPYRQDCVDHVRRLGIGDKVKFVGFIPRSELDSYYTAADLFFFASITETQGLVVQEAMMHGLPAVVAFGGGACASIVEGENGFVTKNEPVDLAGAALQILEDEELYARMSGAAPLSVRDLGIPVMCERVLAVYYQVIRDQRVNDNRSESRAT
jgi:1,2-diacylglycerol 3-alpha-glucosyltransferase